MSRQDLLQRISDAYSAFPPVEAIALAGSQTTNLSDVNSDIDLYVYVTADLANQDRRRVAEIFSPAPEVGNTFFEPGDEWIDAPSGIAIDVMFRRKDWIEVQLNKILKDHVASVGYSTCFWHNVLTSRLLFDRHTWFAELLRYAHQPFPQALRDAIIRKNFPLLRNTQSSFLRQLERAISREDLVSVQHRTTALLSSYFDVLFAINRIPHPGEKRLIAFVKAHCERIPPCFNENIHGLIGAPLPEKNGFANLLIDGLESLLKE